jgi:hypothetical protein
MSQRLQVLVPEQLDARIRKAAERNQVSIGEWVRRAIEEALRHPSGGGRHHPDPLLQLASLDAPTADIEVMLREIEAGRS